MNWKNTPCSARTRAATGRCVLQRNGRGSCDSSASSGIKEPTESANPSLKNATGPHARSPPERAHAVYAERCERSRQLVHRPEKQPLGALQLLMGVAGVARALLQGRLSQGHLVRQAAPFR